MSTLLRSLIVLAPLTAAGVALADDDPRVWLQRMTDAVERLSYEGELIHISDGKFETMFVARRVSDDGRVSERLVSRESGREVIRRDERVKCILQEERSVVVASQQSPLRTSLPVYSRELDRYYAFIWHGEGRVIDRDARVIEVRPRDRFRYGHRLWLDVESSMPLRAAMLDEAGNIVEQILFTSLSLSGEIEDEALEAKLEHDDFTWIVNDEHASGKRPAADDQAAPEWQPAQVPGGFELAVVRGEPSGREHQIYSDGLAAVSIFIEEGRPELPVPDGLTTIGTANAWTTTVEGHKVTVLGEVPPSTVEMIGASLKRRR